MLVTEFHWWPDCPRWPTDESQDTDPERNHAVAHSPEEVTCPICRRDPDVRPPDNAE